MILFLLAGTVFSQTNDLKTKVFVIKHGEAREMLSVFEHLKSEDGKVTVHDSTNTVIIVDHPENLRMMEDIIVQLDVQKKQVMITVIIAEVTGSFLNRVGLTLQQGIIPPEKFSEIQYLLNESEGSEIRSEMGVRTISGEPARLQVAREIFYGSTVQRAGDVLVYTPPQTRAAGNFLEVVPKVNNDGTITVTIRPEMSEFQGDDSIHERSILTQTVVNSGDTIMLGGLGTLRRQAEQYSVPDTGIYVAGEGSEEDVRMTMFLTATVVE
ncbi:type II secretion system protein GspD [Candidatus Omnitrophota bacterium]